MNLVEDIVSLTTSRPLSESGTKVFRPSINPIVTEKARTALGGMFTLGNSTIRCNEEIKTMPT